MATICDHPFLFNRICKKEEEEEIRLLLFCIIVDNTATLKFGFQSKAIDFLKTFRSSIKQGY